MTSKPLYLDYNATAPLAPQAFRAMTPHLTRGYGNSLSGHRFGLAAHQGLEQARSQLGALIGAPPEDLIFTSGGTEAINMAIKGLAFARLSGPRRILIGATEHHAVEDAVRWLEKFGFSTIRIPVDGEGRVSLPHLEHSLQEAPALLVAVMWANNEVGTLQPVEAIGALCRRFGAVFLCDAVQAVGKVAVDVRHVDLLPMAAHKFYGPKGIGALYVRSGLTLDPLLHGAGHERGRRAGTSPVALAVGMGEAARMAHEEQDARFQHLQSLQRRLEDKIIAGIPGAVIHGRGAERLPNTTCVSFEGVPAWELQEAMDREGVALSAGAACRSGVARPSPTLVEMGVDPSLALGGIRISTGSATTGSAVDRAVAALRRAIRTVRQRNASA